MITRAKAAFLAACLGACSSTPVAPAPASLEVVPQAVQPGPFLRAAAARARAAGAGELEPLGAAVVSEGDQIGSFVEVPEAMCMLALARPGPSIRDVDLFVYSDAGDRLAADEAPDARAGVLVCPPHPRRVYVAARVMAGHGMLALGVMPVAAARADAVARAVNVRGRPGQDTGKLEAWPGLERKVRERREQLGSSWEDIRRLAMPLDPRAPTAVTLPIGAGRCIDVLVTPGEELSSIDAIILDAEGRVLSRGKPPGRDRAFVLCSAIEQSVTLLVRPRLAAGLAAVVVGQTAPGAVRELAEHVWVDGGTALVALPEAVERHRRRLALAKLGPERQVAQGEVGVGAVKSLPMALEGGCTRLDVVAGAPMGPFDAELWSARTESLMTGHGGAEATLFYCGKAATVTLDVVARDQGGPVAVWARRDPKPPPLLMLHPRAAAQLLARLESSAGPVNASAAAAAEIVRVEGRLTRPLDVAVGACAEAIAAPAGRARGLSLTVHDARRELGRGRGLDAARVEACAAEAGPLRLTLEVDSGPADVLLLVRPLEAR